MKVSYEKCMLADVGQGELYIPWEPAEPKRLWGDNGSATGMLVMVRTDSELAAEEQRDWVYRVRVSE